MRCTVSRVLTIDDLPDEVLLEIFDSYVFKYQDWDLRQPGNYVIQNLMKIESWQSLVHVCRRWRGLVFGSPRYLNLHLCYTPGRFSGKSLDVWPALPLVIHDTVNKESLDDVIAVLEHSDRISHIDLNCYPTWPPWQIERLWAAMQGPVPELVALYLSYGDRSDRPILPDSFLGGSAAHLRYFYLRSISFPGLSNLLSSATHLVNLTLLNIPHSGWISPDVMATCLSMLTSLEKLRLEIELYYPDLRGRPPFPPTLSVLPTLTTF